MNPQLRDIVQQMLTATCQPRTNPHNGAYADNTVPPTTAEFFQRLDDTGVSFKANAWTLDELERVTLIDNAKTIYRIVYGGWVNNPLPGDAPPEVVAWQKTA